MYKKAQNFDHPPIHDPTVINYILHPNHFEVKKVAFLLNIDNYRCRCGEMFFWTH
jgi:inosine-uridine nucleoside N-ribohydrolase